MKRKITRIGLLVFFIFSVSPCFSQSCDWELSHPYLFGDGYYGVWGYSPDNYYVTTYSGVYRYDGTTFSYINTGSNSPKRICGYGRSHLFGVNERPDLFHGNGGRWSSELATRCDYNFYDIWGASPSDVYVAGSCDFGPGTNGEIIRYNGTTWTTVRGGIYDYLDVWGFSATNVYATGIFTYYDLYDGWLGPWGYMFHYDGASWTGWEMAYQRNPYCIFGTGSSEIWTGGYDFYRGGYISGDGKTEFFSDIIMIKGLWGNSRSNMYAIGDDYILHYDGSTWTEDLRTGTGVTDIFGVSADDIMATCYGKIFHYGGTSWSPIETSVSLDNFQGVWTSSPDNIYAAGDNGEIIQYDGTGWRKVYENPDYSFYEIWGSSPSDIYAVGDEFTGSWHGRVVRFDGVTWSEFSALPPTQHLRSVWGLSSSDIYMVGTNGMVLHYDGSTWNLFPTGTLHNLTDIWGTAPNNLYVTARDGVILHYDGVTWSEMATGTSNDFMGIWGSSTTDIFAVGYVNTFRHYDGSTWTPQITVGSQWFEDVWGTSSSDVYAVGAARLIHYNGTTWSTVATNMPSTTGNAIHGSGPDHVCVAGSGGKVLRYRCSSAPVIPAESVTLTVLLICLVTANLFKMGSHLYH